MNKKLVLGCSIPLVLFMVGGYVGVRRLMHTEPKPEPVETVRRGDVEIKVVENGTIEPLRKVEVKSKVGGRLLEMKAEEGDVVKTGQLMVKIDPQEINSQVAALQSQLKGSEARLAAAKKNAFYQKDQTSTSIDQYVQNLASAEARLKSVEADSGVQQKITDQTIAAARASLASSQASLKAQQESLELMRQSTHPQNITSAQSALDQAKAQAENAFRNLDRQKQLLKSGYVARQVVDQAQTDYDVALAHQREVQQKRDLQAKTNQLEESNLRSQIEASKGQVSQQEAALIQAEASVLPATKLQDLAGARAAVAQAKAQLVGARSGKTQDQIRKDDVTAAEAEVEQLRNQLAQLQVQQADTTLYAPMDGVVTKKYSEVGELITSAIASFGSGTPIYQVADLSTMLIKINVNEVDVAKLKAGLLTEVTIDSSRGTIFQGKIRRVSPSAAGDSTTSAATTAAGGVIRFPVQIQIDQANSLLKPGMSARCSMIVNRKKAVLRVPVNCVKTENGKSTVQIVTSTMKDGHKVESTTPREVKIGLKGDDYIEVVSGLSEGEKVRPNPFSGPPRKTIDIDMGDNNRGNNG